MKKNLYRVLVISMFFYVKYEATKGEKKQPQSQKEIEKAVKKAKQESKIRRAVLNNMPKSSQAIHALEKVCDLDKSINYGPVKDDYREERAEEIGATVLPKITKRKKNPESEAEVEILEEVSPKKSANDLEGNLEFIQWVIENSFSEQALQDLHNTFIAGMFETLSTGQGRRRIIAQNDENKKRGPILRHDFLDCSETQKPADWLKENFKKLQGALDVGLKAAFARRMREQLVNSFAQTAEGKKMSKKEEKIININFFDRMRVNFIRFFCVHQVLCF